MGERKDKIKEKKLTKKGCKLELIKKQHQQ